MHRPSDTTDSKLVRPARQSPKQAEAATNANAYALSEQTTGIPQTHKAPILRVDLACVCPRGGRMARLPQGHCLHIPFAV